MGRAGSNRGRGHQETPAEALARRNAEAAAAEGGEGAQDSYLPPDVPPGTILPPTGTQFANATWMPAGEQIVRIVQRVLGYDEMKEIAELDYDVLWRRNGKPFINGEPVFATVDIAPARWVWQAAQQELLTFPRFVIDLRWPHFDDMRRGKREGEGESAEHVAAAVEYVHEQVLERHIHHALMGLDVTNDIVSRKAPDFAGFAKTVERFGLFNGGVTAVVGQGTLWAQRDDG